MTKNEVEIIWASGLFEGEGYIVRRPLGNRVYMQLGLQTTDLDVLERFVRTMKSNGVTPSGKNGAGRNPAQILQRKQRKPHHKPAWSWSITGLASITGYELMRPHLGTRRRQVGDSIRDECLSAQAEALAERMCKQCSRMFTPNPYGNSRQFCSDRCHGKWKREHYSAADRARVNENHRRYKLRNQGLSIDGQLTLG